MNDEKYIAMKIKELRKNAGLDVDSVGAGVGRSGKTVSAWETGRNVPSAEMLITICRFFDVNISYFYPPDVTEEKNAAQELSPDEQELVALYRLMPEDLKRNTLESARVFAGYGGIREKQRGGSSRVAMIP